MSYDKKSQHINNLVSMPMDQLLDHFSKQNPGLAEVAPNITPHLNNIATKAITYLHSSLPISNTILPGDNEAEPSKSQKEAWLEKYEAVNDPISILDHIRHGTLTGSHMTALNAVHPALLQEMRNRVMDHMNGKSVKSLPYSTQIALTKFIGQPISSSLTPQNITNNQMIYASQPGAQPQQQQGKPTRKSSTVGALEKIDVSKRSATQIQDLEHGTDE